MDESSARPSAEALLAHVEWVRRLTRILVADPDDAADVEQETWRHALERTPAQSSQLRRWLAAVARNVARKLVRAERMQQRHERGLAVSSASSPADLVTARAELHHRVVDAVLSLDESYRAALLLRFFDDLPPREVARALNVPVETARTRIKRGLELVRGRLVANTDNESSRRELERALAPLLSGPGVATTVAGVSVMAGTIWKLAGAAAVIAAVALIGRQLLGTKAAPQVEQAVAAMPRAASDDTLAAEVAAPRPAEATGPTRVEAASDRVLLRGFVVDGTGALVTGASITWDAVAFEKRDGEDGSRRMPWAAIAEGEYAVPPLPRARVTFHVKAAGCQPLDATLDLTKGGGVQRHDFVLARAFRIPFRIVRTDGSSLWGETKGTEAEGVLKFGLAVVATEAPLPAQLPPRTSTDYQHYGIGKTTKRELWQERVDPAITEGTDGFVDVPHLPVELSLLVKNAVVERAHVDAADAVVTFTIGPTRLDSLLGHIVGRIVDEESGAPLGGVNVGWGDAQQGGPGLPTRADGRFDLGPLGPGFLKFTVSGHDVANSWREGRDHWVRLDPGQTLDLGDVRIARGITLNGTLLDEQGQPTTAMIAVHRQDLVEPGLPLGTNNFWAMEEAGKVVVPNLGRHRYVLVAGEPGEAGRQAIAGVDVTGPSPPPITMQFVKTVAVTFVSNPRSESLAAALALTTAGICATFPRWDARESAGLVPGHYRLTIVDGRRTVRSVEFDVASEPLRVEFSLDDVAPPTVTVARPEPPLAIAPSPTEATAPAAAGGDHRPSLLLIGRVTDRSGEGVADATVSARSASGTRRSARTNGSGDYALPGLAAGRHFLVVSGDGRIAGSERIELVESAEPRRLDFTLERTMKLKVTLTDLAGAPLAEALSKRSGFAREDEAWRVVATLNEPAGDLPRDAPADVGDWQPDDDFHRDGDSGTLEIQESPPLYISAVFADRVLATEVLSEPRSELTIAVDPDLVTGMLASVRFRLVDAVTREPILRAGASLLPPNSWGASPVKDLPPEEGGVWSFDQQPPGERNLCLRIDGIERDLSMKVRLAPGRLNDLGDIAIARDLELRGRVVDEAGRPVKTRLSIRTAALDGGWEEGVDYGSMTDDEGRFTLRTGAPRLRIGAGGEWAFDPKVVDVAQLGGAEVPVVLRRGVPVALRPRQGSRGPFRFALRRADGETLAEWTMRGPEGTELRLAPGTYRVTTERNGERPEERSFTVADAPLDLDL